MVLVLGAPEDRILLALGIVLARRSVATAIVRASKLDHLAANVRAVESGLAITQAGTEKLYRRFDLTEQEFRSHHLFGIRVPGEYDFESLKDRLADGGVSVSLRGSAIRVSPHVYNDRDDVDALRKALEL